MTKIQGIPRIESELVVGMALLQWTPRQLSEYASAIGYPVSVEVIEDAMAMSMNRFALTANPATLANLVEVLATLGIGFAHEVFGVIRNFNVRLAFGERCLSVIDGLRVLLQHLDEPRITLAVQKAADASEARSLVVLIETPYSARLIFDAGPVGANDLQGIVALLYSTWLTRLMVTVDCITNCPGNDVEAAISTVLEAPSLPAINLSKARALQLLSGEETNEL